MSQASACLDIQNNRSNVRLQIWGDQSLPPSIQRIETIFARCRMRCNPERRGEKWINMTGEGAVVLVEDVVTETHVLDEDVAEKAAHLSSC
jgi:hypothetical protein